MNGRMYGDSVRYKAETHWFPILKAMIDDGDLAVMTGSSVKVYLIIKAHANYQTGSSFPSLQTISVKSGLSVSQVKREIARLVKLGCVAKSKAGRKNVYTLREKIHVHDLRGEVKSIATLVFRPAAMQIAIDELKVMLTIGELTPTKLVNVERYQIIAPNITTDKSVEDFSDLPSKVRAALLRIRKTMNRNDDSEE